MPAQSRQADTRTPPSIQSIHCDSRTLIGQNQPIITQHTDKQTNPAQTPAPPARSIDQPRRTQTSVRRISKSQPSFRSDAP